MSDHILSESVAQDQLRAFIERIERMEEEKKAISDDIKEIYAEARGNGFDTKVLRQLIRIRKIDVNERMEQEALLDLYMGALGMAPMPLFDDDDEPPSGGRRQPEHRAESTGLHHIGSVASGIVASLSPSLHEVQETNPASAASNSQAERRPESTEQSAGANAEERAPASSATNEAEHGTVSSADYQREPASVPLVSEPLSDADAQRLTAGPHYPGGDHATSEGNALASQASVDHHALDTADLDPARVLLANCIECRARIYEGDDHRVIGPNEEFFCSDCMPPPEAAAPAIHSNADVDQGIDQPVPNRQAAGSNPAVSSSFLGGAADATGSSNAPVAPSTKLKMNAEFFHEPHPLCQRPGFCGGNSNVALCEVCKAAAGQGAQVEAEHRVLN